MRAGRAPISFEWTVPFGNGFFHLGVHNLPAEHGCRVVRPSQRVHERVSREPLSAILADLQVQRGTLLVFCHPLWDLAGVGRDEHTRQVRRFLGARIGLTCTRSS